MRTVLLDLDGTLTDPEVGILTSLDHALAAMGLPPVPPERRHACIGPPLGETFAAMGVAEERLDDAVAAYREYFAPIGMLQNRVYDGIPEALAALDAAGLRLAVATSKPEPYARAILEHFGLDHWFAHIAGATLDCAVSAKADVIALALGALGLPAGSGNGSGNGSGGNSGASRGPGAGSGTVMVGDRSHDVLGAAAHGLPCIGVGWGFAAPGELDAAGAVAVARDPEDLVRLLLA